MYQRHAAAVEKLIAAGDKTGAKREASLAAPFGRFDPAYKG
jgi:hypothetical protein